MKIIPLGDSALVIRLRETLDDPRATLALVLGTTAILRHANLPGIVEITSAFTGIGVFFDPSRVAAAANDKLPNEWLAGQIQTLLRRKKSGAQKLRSRLIEIPVCYEEEFAPDLLLVAEHTRLAPAEVIKRHAAAEYRVHCLGFTPGFAYLSGLPPKLATPRRDTPRKEVPAGAVAIGGEQTGVYPQTSPGGWNLIGRSPMRFFDANSARPTLLQAGDRIRFQSITRAKFASLSS